MASYGLLNMSKTLFVGRKTTFKRGGRLVFEALYQEYGENKLLIEIDSSSFSIIRSFFSELNSLKYIFQSRKFDIDFIIIQHNDLREILIALLVKFFHKKAVLFGPLYHFENSSINILKVPFKKILVKFNQKLSFLIYLSKFKVVLTEDDSIKEMLNKKARQIIVIVERFGANSDIALSRIISKENKEKLIDLLYLGAFDPSKGIWDFLNALLQINQHNLSICISGFSNENMIKEVCTFLQKNQLKKVDIKPNISESEKYDLLHSSKVLVVPSYFEGIPITFQEAMFTRCLVLAYYLPSYNYFKERIFTVPLHEIKALGEEMLKLVNNYEKYSTIIEKNLIFASNNTLQIVAKRVIGKIETIKSSI